jgi:outer membrane protein assembly factor BamB
VYALQGDTGAVRWKYTTQDTINAGPVVSADGTRVFVGSNDMHVYVLAATSGALLWQANVGAPVELPPLLANNATLVVEGNDGRLVAFDTRSGAVLWQTHVASGWISDLFVIPALPLVFVGSADFVLFAFDLTTGATRWSYTIPHYYGVKGFAAGPDNTLYVSGDHLYAFAGATGTLQWRYTWSTLSVMNAVAYAAPGFFVLGVEFVNQTRGVMGFSLAQQAPAWAFVADGPIESTPLVVAATGIGYVGSIPGTLYAFTATTGARLWSLPLDPLAVSTPAVGRNGTIIATTLNTVVCVAAS